MARMSSPAAVAATASAPVPRPRHHQRFQRTVRLVVRALDLVLINVAFRAAYVLRYDYGIGGDVTDENLVPYDVYLPLQAGLALTLLAVFQLGGIYRSLSRRFFLEEAWNILLATSFGMTLFFAVVFLVRGFAYSRGLFLIAWVLTIALLICVRVGVRLVLAVLRGRGIGVRRVLVVGGEPLGMHVMHVLATEPGLGYRLAGFVDGLGADLGRFRCLGTLDSLTDVIRLHQIDEVIVALPFASHPLISEIAEQCAREGATYRIVPDLFELSLGLSQVDVDDLRGIPVMGMKEVTIQGSDLVLKRALDVAFAGAVLVLGSPLWLLISLAIKLNSPGPVFFVQTRVGKDGSLFPALKFRSMRVGAEDELARIRHLNEASGPLFKIRDDPRITWVGRWLRRTSLDELPQLWNVLKGEMSLVGPRPPLPAEVEKYLEWHSKRLKVAPGMTGLWQVSGRSELPFDEMVLLDIYYIENWSLGMDFQILFRTLPAVLSGRGAY